MTLAWGHFLRSINHSLLKESWDLEDNNNMLQHTTTLYKISKEYWLGAPDNTPFICWAYRDMHWQTILLSHSFFWGNLESKVVLSNSFLMAVKRSWRQPTVTQGRLHTALKEMVVSQPKYSTYNLLVWGRSANIWLFNLAIITTIVDSKGRWYSERILSHMT